MLVTIERLKQDIERLLAEAKYAESEAGPDPIGSFGAGCHQGYVGALELVLTLIDHNADK